MLLLIYLEFVVFFQSRFFVSMDKAKAGAKKGIAIINCLWIVIISLFIAFDCSMQQNIVVRKKGSKPGHAFKKFIDKNYIASTIHGVLFPFDGFFFALHIWCGEVVAVVVVVRSSMNRH